MLFNIVPEDFPQGRPRCFHGFQNSNNAGHLREFLHALAFGGADNDVERLGCCSCQSETRQSCQMSQQMRQRVSPSPASVKPTIDEKEVTEKVHKVNLGSLDFRGSSPKQVSVKVTSEAIVVTGRHNSVEIIKTFPFPPNMDSSRIGCRYRDGQVIVELPIPENEALEGTEDCRENSCTSEKQMIENIDESKERTERHNEEQKGAILKECLDERVDNLAELFSPIFGASTFDLKQDDNPKSGENQDEKKEPTEKEDEAKKSTPDWASETMEAQAGQKDEVANCNTTTVFVNAGDWATPHTDLFDDNPELQVENDDFVHVEKQTTQDAKSEQTILSDATVDAEVDRIMSEERKDLQEFRESFAEGSDVVGTDVSNETADFKVQIDLSNYNPEDVRVVFKDGHIFVEAEREIKGDNYCQTENLSRRIQVPETVDVSKLTSVLSSTGVMTIQTTSIRREMDEEEACHVELME